MENIQRLRKFLNSELESYIHNLGDCELEHGANLLLEHMHEVFVRIREIDPTKPTPKVGDIIEHLVVLKVHAPMFYVVGKLEDYAICQESESPDSIDVRYINKSYDTPKSIAKAYSLCRNQNIQFTMAVTVNFRGKLYSYIVRRTDGWKFEFQP